MAECVLWCAEIPLSLPHLTLVLKAAAIFVKSTLLKGAVYCTSAFVRISLVAAGRQQLQLRHTVNQQQPDNALPPYVRRRYVCGKG